MSLAICVDNLGKRYRVDHAAQRGEYQTLREAIVRGVSAPWRRLRHGPAGCREDFWALRDVSFDVRHGESVGIIGRNGAGKSTLLKILSQITKPTTGCVQVYGRVASLLEVGTGFHPELTGRENIFLNGSILGMSRAEIRRKFDEIVDFSGVEQFLDTPIKRYSSGMKVRLAFSVAAHLEPEILVIDEVLAVGDAEFQKKCLGKMGEVAQSGRTVLFVSHNMAAVQSLCSSCIVLGEGRAIYEGPSEEAIALYVRATSSEEDGDLSSRTDRRGVGDTQFAGLTFLDHNGVPTDTVSMGSAFAIRVLFRSRRSIRKPTVAVIFHTVFGQRLFRLHSTDVGLDIHTLSDGDTIAISVASMPLLPGSYPVTLGAQDEFGVMQDLAENASTLHVRSADVLGTGKTPCGPGDLIYVPAKWRLTN